MFDLNVESEIADFKKNVDGFLNKRIRVELKKVYNRRTLNQNSFLHVLITLFGIEFGYTVDEAKTILKRNCPFMRYEKKGSWFLKKTSDMTTEELANFIDWIYNYSSKNGFVLPTLEEYSNYHQKYEKEIKSNMVYM
jgi:hypothetical protein